MLKQLTALALLAVCLGCTPAFHDNQADQADRAANTLRAGSAALNSPAARTVTRLVSGALPEAEPARGIASEILGGLAILLGLYAAWQRAQAKRERDQASKKEAQVNALAVHVPADKLAGAFLDAANRKG